MNGSNHFSEGGDIARSTVISLKNCERSDRTLARISSNM
jgi:hypothetical protein